MPLNGQEHVSHPRPVTRQIVAGPGLIVSGILRIHRDPSRLFAAVESVMTLATGSRGQFNFVRVRRKAVVLHVGRRGRLPCCLVHTVGSMTYCLQPTCQRPSLIATKGFADNGRGFPCRAGPTINRRPITASRCRWIAAGRLLAARLPLSGVLCVLCLSLCVRLESPSVRADEGRMSCTSLCSIDLLIFDLSPTRSRFILHRLILCGVYPKSLIEPIKP